MVPVVAVKLERLGHKSLVENAKDLLENHPDLLLVLFLAGGRNSLERTMDPENHPDLSLGR